MARAKTFEAAAAEYAAKFPGKQLLEYTATTEPCLILCDRHGEQSSTSYRSLAGSKYGCPKCGAEAQTSAVSKSHLESDIENPAAALRREGNPKTMLLLLLSIDTNLPDADYRKAVEVILQPLRPNRSSGLSV